MARGLTREELVAMDLSPQQVEEILEKQNQKRERKYRYMAMLTTSEARDLSEQTGKEFVRATDWKGRRKN